MTVLNFEKAAKHQELMREKIASSEMHEMFELIQDHAPVEDVEMFEQSIKRGDYSDAGYLFMKMLSFAATQETAPEVERWADEEEDRELERRRLASPITKAGVYLNTDRFLHQ